MAPLSAPANAVGNQMSSRIAGTLVSLSLFCVSVAGAQSDAANEVDRVPPPDLPEEVAAEAAPAPEEQPPRQESVEEIETIESVAPVEQEPDLEEEQAPAGVQPVQDTAVPQAHLRFRSIRIYAGAALQMAPADSPESFETVCELPCNTDVDLGVYHLNVRRADGRDYLLPNAINFDGDARISLKYGASTGAWVGGIVALTGILGILITGGIAIAGAANDNSGQTRAGLIGLGVSSVAFGAGLVTFLLSERGLRAEVLESN